jgi:hypothetical protein
MALVRCERHGRPERGTRVYTRSVRPFGFPDTAAICGRAGCLNPGLVWLDEDDERDYLQGVRVFPVPNAGIKVKVE